MDNLLIQLVARLKIRLRQDKSISINTQRFFDDSAYARQTLDSAAESDSVELVALALELRSRLGWTTPTGATGMPIKLAPPLVNAATAGTNPARYKAGAHS